MQCLGLYHEVTCARTGQLAQRWSHGGDLRSVHAADGGVRSEDHSTQYLPVVVSTRGDNVRVCNESLKLGVCCCRAHGAFGVSWLGKAYFICSVVISLLVAWWWDLFCEKSTSRYLLALFFRWVPMAILWHSTSCKDLAAVMVLVALNSDALSQWLLTVWITAEASRQTPSYEHSGQEVCA